MLYWKAQLYFWPESHLENKDTDNQYTKTKGHMNCNWKKAGMAISNAVGLLPGIKTVSNDKGTSSSKNRASNAWSKNIYSNEGRNRHTPNNNYIII